MNEIDVLISLSRSIESKIDKVSDKVEKLSNENVVQKMDIDFLKAEVTLIKSKQKEMQEALDNVKIEPVKEKAEKWKTIIDYTLKAILGLLFTALLAYIGIKKV